MLLEKPNSIAHLSVIQWSWDRIRHLPFLLLKLLRLLLSTWVDHGSVPWASRCGTTYRYENALNNEKKIFFSALKYADYVHNACIPGALTNTAFFLQFKSNYKMKDIRTVHMYIDVRFRIQDPTLDLLSCV